MVNSDSKKDLLEETLCPCCGVEDSTFWANEIGFNVVRCNQCKLLYLNPRPKLKKIDKAVRKGEHRIKDKKLNVRSRRVPKKVPIYKAAFQDIFSDLWQKKKPIIWVDVGSGYGEMLEAVSSLAAPKSTVVGVEPMKFKADAAKKIGLTVYHSYLRPNQFKANVISIVNVFSHIPDFNSFLKTIATNLAPRGEIFIETGNLADLKFRKEFPGELGLPDHLVFAGESQLSIYLKNAGFEITSIKRERVDSFTNLLKNIVKKILKRPAVLGIPYTSKYRQLRIRAKLR